MEAITITNWNAIIGMVFAAFAVFIGVNIRETGLRLYIAIVVTAVLITLAVIETWFMHSTKMASATIGWLIGYFTDDFLLSLNALMPEFVKELLNSVAYGIKNKIDKFLGIDNKDSFK